MSEENKSKLTPGRIALIAAGALVIAVIVLLALSKISITSDGDDDRAETTQFSEEATETPKDEENPTDEPNNEATEDRSSDRPDDAVEDPKMGDSFEAQGEVVDKYVTSADKQYQYVLKIRVSNDSGFRDLEYISTKQAYDGVNKGDKFKVTYSGDSEGNIAVESIAPAE